MAYALRKWTPTVEKKVAELVKAAVSRSLPRPPRPATVVDDSNVSTANEIRGASWGANAGRHEATPGHSQPLSVQLDTTSGHARHRLATAWKCPPKQRAAGSSHARGAGHALFSLLGSPFGSLQGSQSPGASRGEMAEFLVQPGWARTEQRAPCQPDAPAGVAATPSLQCRVVSSYRKPSRSPNRRDVASSLARGVGRADCLVRRCADVGRPKPVSRA